MNAIPGTPFSECSRCITAGVQEFYVNKAAEKIRDNDQFDGTGVPNGVSPL